MRFSWVGDIKDVVMWDIDYLKDQYGIVTDLVAWLRRESNQQHDHTVELESEVMRLHAQLGGLEE